jgi:hypothetical protein
MLCFLRLYNLIYLFMLAPSPLAPFFILLMGMYCILYYESMKPEGINPLNKILPVFVR